GRAVLALSRYHCGLPAERRHSDRAAFLHQRRGARTGGRGGGRSAHDRRLAALRRAPIRRYVSTFVPAEPLAAGGSAVGLMTRHSRSPEPNTTPDAPKS